MFAAARLADEDKAAEVRAQAVGRSFSLIPVGDALTVHEFPVGRQVERLRTLPTAVFMGRLPGTVENEKWSEAMKKIDKGSNDTPGA